MKSILVLTLLFNQSFIYAQNERIIDSYFEFERGSTELLYGDKVVFRTQPNSSSEAIDTLLIGQKVKIIEKSDEKMIINGQESNWFKVKVNGKTGFILGGLIALDNKEINGKTYLVTTAFHDERFYVRVRVVAENHQFYGHETALATNAFTIKAFNNRGIEGVKDMLKVDLIAEACGIDGGEFYLFNDGSKLIESIHLTKVADGGAFWFRERVKFPDEEKGEQGVVLYEREFGESINEEMNWSVTTIHSLTLEWKNGAFSPDVTTINFDEVFGN